MNNTAKNDETKKHLKTGLTILLGVAFLKTRRDVKVLKTDVKGLANFATQSFTQIETLTAASNNHHDYLVWLGDVMPNVLEATKKAGTKKLKAV